MATNKRITDLSDYTSVLPVRERAVRCLPADDRLAFGPPAGSPASRID